MDCAAFASNVIAITTGSIAQKIASERASTDAAIVRIILRKGQPFHVDHRQPIARGGSSLADNLQAIPASMNLAKHDLSHEEALERVPGYRAWCEGPATYDQVTYRTQMHGNGAGAHSAAGMV